ncbi:MAG: hypothetical protein JWM93_71 [Frankiales bacterium]|nr:hypothetical protein [Frankiales bacterium]
MYRFGVSAGALAVVLCLSGCGSLSTAGAPRAAPVPVLPTRALPSTGGETPSDGRLFDGGPASPGAACEGDPWQMPGDPGSPAATPSAGATLVRARQLLPDDFIPVLLITCGIEERVRSDGEWTYRVELRATQQLHIVVAALRAPLAPKMAGSYGCTADFRPDPWFVLQDAAGRQVLPDVPHDKSCDKPIDLGLLGLDYTRTNLTPLQQQRTVAQIQTECVSGWKNMPRILAKDSTLTPMDVPLTLTRPTHVCVYGATPSDPDVGTFTGGATLGSSEAKALGSALQAAHSGPANCQSTDDFAVVFADNDSVYVELSGCHRVFGGNGNQVSGPAPDVAAAINALKLQR